MNSWKWLLALFAIACFAETLFWGQMSAFTPLYLPLLGVAEPEIARWTGLIASLSSLIGIPFLPIWGALADRYSRQPVIIRSFVVHVIAGILAMVASNVWIFLAARAVMNLSFGNTGLMMTTLTERVPSNRVGVAFALVNGAGPVGASLGPLLGGPVVDHWGIRALLALISMLMLIMALLLTFGYRDLYRGKSEGRILPMAVDSVVTIVRSPRLRILFPALFLLFSGWMLAYTYVPVCVLELHHGPDEGFMVGLILGVSGGAALLMGPAIGMLADRFGHWRILFAGAFLEIFLWPIPILLSGLVSFGIAWCVINGFTSGVFAVSFTVLAGSTTESNRGRVMAFSYLPINIGSALGPAIGSLLAGNSAFSIFPAAAVLTAAGIVPLYIAYRLPNDATQAVDLL